MIHCSFSSEVIHRVGRPEDDHRLLSIFGVESIDGAKLPEAFDPDCSFEHTTQTSDRIYRLTSDLTLESVAELGYVMLKYNQVKHACFDQPVVRFQNFVLDFGTEVYAWSGSKTSRKSRKIVASFAQQLVCDEYFLKHT